MKTLFLIIVVLISGCDLPPIKTPRFAYGDIVHTVVGNHRGQVIGAVRCDQDTCFYDIRFSSMEYTTNTHIFSQDGPIRGTPLMLVQQVREYELQ